jgi:hypothetical protein
VSEEDANVVGSEDGGEKKTTAIAEPNTTTIAEKPSITQDDFAQTDAR